MTPATNGRFKSNLKKAKMAKKQNAFKGPPVSECHSKCEKRKATLVLDISKVPIEEKKTIYLVLTHTVAICIWNANQSPISKK